MMVVLLQFDGDSSASPHEFEELRTVEEVMETLEAFMRPGVTYRLDFAQANPNERRVWTLAHALSRAVRALEAGRLVRLSGHTFSDHEDIDRMTETFMHAHRSGYAFMLFEHLARESSRGMLEVEAVDPSTLIEIYSGSAV